MGMPEQPQRRRFRDDAGSKDGQFRGLADYLVRTPHLGLLMSGKPTAKPALTASERLKAGFTS